MVSCEVKILRSETNTVLVLPKRPKTQTKLRATLASMVDGGDVCSRLQELGAWGGDASMPPPGELSLEGRDAIHFASRIFAHCMLYL